MITVLGSNGMLGRYMTQYLAAEGLGREKFDAVSPDFSLIRGDVVINCIGIIKPRVEQTGVAATIEVNSVFPHKLADFCKKTEKKCVHITTDCVFQGTKGKYTETSVHDATDLYGKSKSLGEPENATVIRTSIIGEEKGEGRSLLEWVKTQKGQSCGGFTNHWWNGVTCLQLAKVVEKIIEGDLFWDGVKHIYSPVDITKYYLVDCINKIYDLGIDVKETQANMVCDRTLRSKYEKHGLAEYFKVPELPQQIQELREYNLI